ncbi:MAG: ABC transporter permease [Pseudomonadota bacterium]
MTFVLGLLCLLLLAPLISVFSFLLQGDTGVLGHLVDTVLADYVSHSLLLMAGVGSTVLVIAVLPAWLVTMYRFPLSRLLEWALLLPLAMPAYIIAYTYTGALDVAGPVQTFIRTIFGVGFGEYYFPEIRSIGGATVMLSLVLYPYVYLLARTAFVEQSVCVLEVSRTLGCSPRQAFFRVALPLARPAIVAGMALVLMETLADYGTVQYFGVPVFTTGIFRTWFGLGSSAGAAQLSAMLVTFVGLLAVLEGLSRRQAQYHHTGQRYSRLPRQTLGGGAAVVAFIYCSLPVLLGFVVPVGLLGYWALGHWQSVVDDSFLELATNTLLLALTVALIALLPALFAAYARRRRPGQVTSALHRCLGLGYAMPGTVIAVGVLIPFAWFDNTLDEFMRDHFDVSTGLLLSGTVFALIFAYVVRFVAVSLGSVDAGLSRLKPAADDVARTLGLTGVRILYRVHLPVMRGSLLTAALLVFVDVMKELPATLVLRPFNFNTLAVKTYELANDERLMEAATPALLIVIVGILPVVLLSRAISGSRVGE